MSDLSTLESSMSFEYIAPDMAQRILNSPKSKSVRLTWDNWDQAEARFMADLIDPTFLLKNPCLNVFPHAEAWLLITDGLRKPVARQIFADDTSGFTGIELCRAIHVTYSEIWRLAGAPVEGPSDWMHSDDIFDLVGHSLERLEIGTIGKLSAEGRKWITIRLYT